MKAVVMSERIVISRIERPRNIGADRSNKRRIGLFLSLLMGMARPGFISQSLVLKSILHAVIPTLFESPARSALRQAILAPPCTISIRISLIFIYLYIFIHIYSHSSLSTRMCIYIHIYVYIFSTSACRANRYSSVCAISTESFERVALLLISALTRHHHPCTLCKPFNNRWTIAGKYLWWLKGGLFVYPEEFSHNCFINVNYIF